MFDYPQVKRSDTKEQFFTYSIQDPYDHLIEPAEEFLNQQNKLFQAYIADYPKYKQYQDTLTKLYDYERTGCPFKRGDVWYFFYNPGLLSQNQLFRSKDLNLQERELFFDPNALSDDGTVSLSTYSFSESGALFAYGLSESGSDWVTIYVMDCKTKQKMKDTIKFCKFTSIAWYKDEGFYYHRYPAEAADKFESSNKNGMLYYHKVGTEQSEDKLIINDSANPEHMFGAEVSDDQKYLIVSVSESCDPVNKLYIKKLDEEESEFIKVVDDFRGQFDYLTNKDQVFYFKTNFEAGKYKIVKFDLKTSKFSDVVPETKNVLQFATCINGQLVLCYLVDAKNEVYVYDYNGKLKRKLELLIGSVDSLSGRWKDTLLFVKLSNFLNPGQIFKYDFDTDNVELFLETKLDFDASKYVQDQVFYASKDGTKVPMFIVRKKDVKLDGSNPTLLYGYGGFNISLTPFFSPSWLTFMAVMNGIVCVANLRGGGEYGDEWHKAGQKLNKQNVFDDFQHAAKYLIDQKYTIPAKLAINGGSNGGLLVGACINQRPDLFGCGVADVGVFDMLRFDRYTIGHAWKSDFGDPNKLDEFENLLKYSPLHNVKKPNDGGYPAVLLTTSDHDDRVVPHHTFKFIAALQHELKENEKPLMMRVETKAGHGAGKPTKKRIEEATDKFSFIGKVLGVHD